MELEIPEKFESSWSHHLVQLAGPPNEQWIQSIKETGVEVVEPISAYGLFVVGSPDQVKRLKDLPFVEWTGLFKPAYRISSNLQDMKGRIRFLNIGVYQESATNEVKQAIKKAAGVIVNEWDERGIEDGYHILLVELDASKVAEIGQCPN